MKRKFLLVSILSPILAFSQIDIAQPAGQLQESIEAAFPIIASIIFLVVVFFNLGHFTQEGGDWKKGVSRIVIYVVIVGIIAGLYSAVTNINL